jgi:phosphomannomutase
MADIKFGTDGWRAVIADAFTMDNVRRVAQASADHATRHAVAGTGKQVVIGYDRRFMSDRFAAATAEVFAGNDFEVLLTPLPTPTPAVSLAVRDHTARLGVVITASHNPPHYNGFKLKSHYGGPSDPQTCGEVEACLDQTPVRHLPLEEGIKQQRITVVDLIPDHLRAVKRYVDFQLIARSGLRLAHDALFGVGAGCFNRLLHGTRCRVTLLNGVRDVLFGGINPEPVSANYRLCSKWLRRHPHDFCLVTDGDADRVGAMDGRGRPISTHEVICLLLQHLRVNRGRQGRVLKALTTTSMVDRMCEDYGLPLVETGVGFKYICAEMLKGNVLLGGEESGGIGFPGHIPERDGILAGMLVLEMLAMERCPVGRLLKDLERRYGPHRYARVDAVFPVERRTELMEFCRSHPPAKLLRSPVEAMHTFDGVKYVARDHSWLMLRGSGTESVLRIYAEAGFLERAQKLIEQGLRMAKQVLKT